MAQTIPNGSIHGTGLAQEAGKLLAEAFVVNNSEKAIESLKEANINISESYNGNFSEAVRLQEDITSSNASGSYVNLLAKTIATSVDVAMADVLELVEVNDDMVNNPGHGAYQFPRIMPTIAKEISEGQVVNTWNEGVDEITLVPKTYGTGVAMTRKILKRGHPKLMQYILKKAVDAVKSKMISDIVNGLAVGAGDTQTGGVSYDNCIDGIAKLESEETSAGVPYGFTCTHLVMNKTNFAALQKDTDYLQQLAFTSVATGPTVARPIKFFGEAKVVTTPYLDSANALGLFVDANNAAVLIKGSEIETYEGRINGRVDDEVIVVTDYVLGLIFPKGVVKLTA